MADPAARHRVTAAELQRLEGIWCIRDDGGAPARGLSRVKGRSTAPRLQVACNQLGDVLRVIHYIQDQGCALRVLQPDTAGASQGTASPPLILEILAADSPAPPVEVAAPADRTPAATDAVSHTDAVLSQPRVRIGERGAAKLTVHRLATRVAAGVLTAAVAVAALTLTRAPRLGTQLVTQRGYVVGVPAGWTARTNTPQRAIEMVPAAHRPAGPLRMFDPPSRQLRFRIDFMSRATFAGQTSQAALNMVAGYVAPYAGRCDVRVKRSGSPILGHTPLAAATVGGRSSVSDVIMVEHGEYVLVLHATAPSRAALWWLQPRWRAVVRSLRRTRRSRQPPPGADRRPPTAAARTRW